ncbi:LysR substrate-binding domain-containing protein [Brevibacillus ruminantium]|uniref:LysR substrate-binding domain-containing protein n=1 Tax=Brevibacillus ruminantium TaxID=2950604 RepID=A0ABY4WJ45_9BACL|nr:LysR family transcriptional regulator [Brevibacillus ruminantium]USG67155.1 LysR substrate-binding domain-containing protein [Brevibacillus ruminantium]
MEISDLRIFQAVAECGSVSKAAKTLSYVQSNVTARIQQLELKLDTELFYRHRKGMTLTADGKKLLAYSQKILAMMEEVECAFQNDEDPSGPLLVGSVETVSCLPSILSLYHKKYPRVDLSLMSGVTEHLIQDVLQYELDGAFVSGPVQHPEIVQELLIEEELVLIAKAEGGPQTLEECSSRPLLVFRSGCGYRARLVQWLKSRGVEPTKIMELGTLETILAMVASGLGVTLVPRATISRLEHEGSIRLFSIPADYATVSTVFIYRRDSHTTGAMKRFLETLHLFRQERGASTA